MKQATFMAAAKEFFGMKDGQTSMDFAKEIRALSEDDRKEIAEGLKAHGFEVTNA